MATKTKATKTKATPAKMEAVSIKRPNLKTVKLTIEGVAPYVQNKFSHKAKEAIKATQMAGSTAKKGKKREPKDFQACYEAAMYRSVEGWNGMPASAFRAAMISACRVCGFQMTKAKLAVFVEADGFDPECHTPLVKFSKGKPHYVEHPVRLEAGGMDIRPRPMWDIGWQAIVRIRYDADLFTAEDIFNLMMRVGLQVGIGEGRPDARKSCGMGWGLFEIVKAEG